MRKSGHCKLHLQCHDGFSCGSLALFSALHNLVISDHHCHIIRDHALWFHILTDVIQTRECQLIATQYFSSLFPRDGTFMECVYRDSVLVSETRKNVWYTSTHVSDKAGVAYIRV